MYIAKVKVLSTRLQMFYGFVFTSVMGVILHFLYGWTGDNPFISLFSPINESPWEHLKTVFYPILFFLIIQLIYLRWKKIILHNLTWYTSVSSCLAMAFITVSYYTFTGITGMNIGWFNIAIFFISAAMAYYFNYKMIKASHKRIPHSTLYGVLIFLTFIGLFITFTLSPPDLPWFKSPTGIQ